MNLVRRCGAALALLAVAGLAASYPLAAGEKDKKDDKKPEMEFPKPGPEHKGLAQLAGTFDAKVKMWMDPSAKDPQESTGTLKRTMILEGRYMREEFTGKFMDKKFQGIGLVGYDTQKKQYFMHWIDTFSTAVSVSVGSYDADKKTYTHRGSEVMGGKKFLTKDVLKVVSDDEQAFEMYRAMADAPDKEFKVMEITYTRAKKKKDKIKDE